MLFKNGTDQNPRQTDTYSIGIFVEHFSDLGCKIGCGERLLYKVDALIEHPLMGDSIGGIT